MRIALIDTAYPAFLNSLAFDESSTYEQQLRHVLSLQFGTSDFFSRNLRALGHECVDILGNYEPLQRMWARENSWDDVQIPDNESGRFRLKEIALHQIEKFKPDILFLQDFSFFDEGLLRVLSDEYLLAGQLSCPWPGDGRVSKAACIFSSFPHYIKRFESLGVRAVYLPLAFEPSVREGPQPERDIDISLVGGVGRESHWKYGTDVLEAVAAAFPERFHWYGYGLDNLPASSALRACYRGQAWGRQMYDVYRRSRIGITRHGEVANGFTNNLRVYEVTGSGALLMTEESPNLRGLFPEGTAVSYSSAADLCQKIDHFLSNENARETMAAWGQNHTLAHHTYAQRMKVVSDVLQEILVAA